MSTSEKNEKKKKRKNTIKYLIILFNIIDMARGGRGVNPLGITMRCTLNGIDFITQFFFFYRRPLLRDIKRVRGIYEK